MYPYDDATAPISLPQRGPQRGRERRRWPKRMAKFAVATVSALVLASTGYAWAFYAGFTGGLTHSDAASRAPKSKDGSTNILIMGLDNRLDQQGNPLPKEVYHAMHVGTEQNGGYNTNVMMLLHVPKDGSKSTLISIPRDDYATLDGSPHGESRSKLKEGYGLRKAAKESELVQQGTSDRPTLERLGREAGRQQTITDVSRFLGGVPIDHFVEVTLVGFYDLAQALGTIKVCVSGDTEDLYYANLKLSKGTHDLTATQALAFVRQRRDKNQADFTDLDRSRRQQAFLASAAFQLKSAGTLANPVKMQGLVEAAQRNIVISSGFDLLGFLGESSGLANGGISYHTLPIKNFAKIDGGDVNVVDLHQIRTITRELLGIKKPPITTLPAGPVDVVNASGAQGLAAALSGALVAKGMTAGLTSTAAPVQLSSISYGPGAEQAARAASELLDIDDVQPGRSVPAGRVRITLGGDFGMPAELAPPADKPAPGTPVPPPVPSADAPKGPEPIQGGSIPCVK
ncbi:LytR family transcriptional regulator [Pseudonocardiaceae bacterium YIM PH 21723]|nr:LytR family transcriptional regulator [Pseudonocardiaceae bacterium YIM PH 21723]